MAASIEDRNITIANSLSDHCAQVDPVARAVSQNLQAPYAIKPGKHGWVFDLPTFINPKSPDYKSLSTMTGLNPQQCQRLVGFMIQNPPMSKEAMIQALQSLGISGIGDVLGQGGFRLSIETDTAYEHRMQRQIKALMGSVAGGADVLNFQEQPYQDIDKKRMRLFSRIMDSLGYTQARGLENRDVGIWVKEPRKKDFTSPATAPHLIKMVESEPFRGCILQDKHYLYLNLHVDRCKSMSELVDKLIELKNLAETYAQQQKPPLSLLIQGDMNLFMLDRTQQQRLRDAGFVVEPVKGQERYAQGTPTCEAYLRASPKLAAALSPVAAAPAFHPYTQSNAAPLPYAPQYQPQVFAPPQQIESDLADLKKRDLEKKRQWLETIFKGGFSIKADSKGENHYYIVHQDKTILKNLSQTLSAQCGIEGRSGKPKFVQTAENDSYIILVEENLPLLLQSGLSFDATAFASAQSSSIASPPASSSYSPPSSSSAPPPLSSQHHSVQANPLAPASPNSPPYITVSSHSDKRPIKIAPFKYEDAAYFGPFANTTRVGHGVKEYRVQQTVKIHGKTLQFDWPSSEHAYHAQKIIFLKENLPEESQIQDILCDMLNEIERSNDKYTGKNYEALIKSYIPGLKSEDLDLNDRLYVSNKAEFDALCHADFNAQHNPRGKKETFNYMCTVIALKVQQHPELAERAMACAREGIFPVEVSQYDYTWAAGLDGTGMNMLGIIWLEIGNALLEKNGEAAAIAIPDPESFYNTHLRNLAQLSHQALEAHTKHPENWPKAHSGTTTHSASASLIDVGPFKHYEAQRAQKGEGFTFFGGFNKDEKIKAVGIFIAAIQHYNATQGSMNGFNQRLSPRQLGALCEGGLGTDVGQIDQEALTVILSAIIPSGLESFSADELKKQLGVDLEKINTTIGTAIKTAIEHNKRSPIFVNFN